MNTYFLCFLLIGYYEYTTCVPTLEVDAKTGHHPISPNIYGLNSISDLEFAKEIKVPFDRWGGNTATRYNWKLDVFNRAADWFFENLPEGNGQNLPEDSSSEKFIKKDKSAGVKTMMTLPLIGWTPKDREKRCGFSVKKYGKQEKTDKFMPDCGNGMHKDGKTRITGNDPHDTNTPINSSFVAEWVEYMVKLHGPASKGGVLFYELDNEYELWPYTHHDVRATGVSYQEILKLNEEYGAIVKKIDPSALVLGPVGTSLLIDGLGWDARKNQGDFGPNYLKGMKVIDTKHNKRLIDYFDVHYYPQSKPEDAIRLRSTRSLWEANYTDESWLRDLGGNIAKINFIPTMMKMIAEHNPGTKMAISEYSWGALDTINGALAQADVLGIQQDCILLATVSLDIARLSQ